jgi:hypothetical protein
MASLGLAFSSQCRRPDDTPSESLQNGDGVSGRDNRVEGRDQAENPFWVVVLYWVCWLLLAGVLAMLLSWRR